LTIKGSVATIELNRPKTLNSINLTMATTLRDLGREITERDDVRVVVLVGAGEAFCGGGDVEFFSENMDNITASVRQLLTAFHEFHVSLWHSSKLVIASVHGAAAGAGFSLVTMADFCIASTDARLVPAYARLGVSPDGGGTYGLVRTVGSKRALQIFLAQEQLTAEEACLCPRYVKQQSTWRPGWPS
jgi:enoyl-CoA hydratase/carnithine racemase